MTQGQKSSSLNLTNETDDIHVTNEPPGKKSRVRRWRIDGKAKTNHRWATSLRLMQRLTMPTCPALNKSNNLIIKDLTNALLEQIRNVWFPNFFTFGSWRRRWWVTNILIPRRLQRVRSRKADTIFSSVMCFLFFLPLSSFFNRYPSCCPWSLEPASPSRPCGLPSGFWRKGALTSLMEVWRRSLTWVWRSTSTRRPDSKVPGSRWGCGRLGCIVRAVGEIVFFAAVPKTKS